MNKKACHYIFGKWLRGGFKPLISTAAATESVLFEGEIADKKTVDKALKAAKTAQTMWKEKTVDQRMEYIHHMMEILQSEKNHLAETISKEVGKPLWESTQEIESMIAKGLISFEAYKERSKEKEDTIKDLTLITRHKPIGVLSVLGPFNFPMHLPNGHIMPALLAGNTIVFKPSEKAALCGASYAKIMEKAKFPDGVFNMVQGDKTTACLLASHPLTDGVLFTGSYQAGMNLTKLVTPNKILALEMGGNNPIVIELSDSIYDAVKMTILSSFITTGQRCTSARRLILIKSRGEKQFIKRLIEETKGLIIGPYDSKPEPFMGPLISEQQAKQIENMQKKLIELGAKPLLKLKRLKNAFVTCGIIDCTEVKNLPDEEIFGPLLMLIRKDNIEDAIDEANKTDYGLSASLISESKEHWRMFYQNIKAGVINWNTPTTGASSKAPFGGIGKSGNYRPSAYYATDYCNYPVASFESKKIHLPEKKIPGM